jgi:hypothetical protein
VAASVTASRLSEAGHDVSASECCVERAVRPESLDSGVRAHSLARMWWLKVGGNYLVPASETCDHATISRRPRTIRDGAASGTTERDNRAVCGSARRAEWRDREVAETSSVHVARQGRCSMQVEGQSPSPAHTLKRVCAKVSHTY